VDAPKRKPPLFSNNSQFWATTYLATRAFMSKSGL
jgi:hypothetical protein